MEETRARREEIIMAYKKYEAFLEGKNLKFHMIKLIIGRMNELEDEFYQD